MNGQTSLEKCNVSNNSSNPGLYKTKVVTHHDLAQCIWNMGEPCYEAKVLFQWKIYPSKHFLVLFIHPVFLIAFLIDYLFNNFEQILFHKTKNFV